MNAITICGIGFLLGVSFYFGVLVAQRIVSAYENWYWSRVSKDYPTDIKGTTPTPREK